MRRVLAGLLILALLLTGCRPSQCKDVREQLDQVGIVCTVEDRTWEFTIMHCGRCECTAGMIEDFGLELGCGKRMDLEVPGAGGCEYEVTLVTGQIEEYGAYPGP